MSSQLNGLPYTGPPNVLPPPIPPTMLLAPVMQVASPGWCTRSFDALLW